MQPELRGLMFGLQGSFSVGLTYTRADMTQRDFGSFRFRFDVGYGYTIADIFEIIGMIGYGFDGVALVEPDSFPSATFHHLRPAVVGRFRAYEELVIIEGGFGGRIGLDGGDLAGAYGPSLFFGGFDIFLGVAGRLDLGLTWAVRFGYQLHALSFSGVGGLYGNGANGTDEAVSIRLLLGYSFSPDFD